MKRNIMLALVFIIGWQQPSLGKQNETNMKFRGFLVEPPPCRINEGGMVDVFFGERVGIKKVDGINYRQAIDYQISCSSPGVLPWKMTLTLRGIATSFDKAAVQTDNDYLGIRLYQDGAPFILNSSIKIDPDHPPRLEAVPIAEPGQVLTEGAFSATATLQADYQ
jgi:type 1 fimbria pilin